jgi:hypothetical protein
MISPAAAFNHLTAFVAQLILLAGETIYNAPAAALNPSA